MRILQVNKFLYRRGGAESYMEDAAQLLRGAGHEVAFWGMSHPENTHLEFSEFFPDQVDLAPPPPGVAAKLGTAARMVWSTQARNRIDEVLTRFAPDVVHLHNIYHQLSPSILGPIRRRGIGVVMTLHDYKLVCPSYQLLDHGRLCQACLGGSFRHAVRRRCKDGSLALSGLLAVETSLHRRFGAYGGVDLFLCPSRFLLGRMREAGVFPERLRHLPNVVVPPPDAAGTSGGDFEGPIVVAGRLSPEKGFDTLIRAVPQLPPGRRVAIAGDGPQAADLRALAAEVAPGRVDFLGRLDQGGVQRLLAGAAILACPSRWHENQPMTLIEAMAAAVPMVGSDLGGISELIRDGIDGALADPDDPDSLARAINRVLADPVGWRDLGMAAGHRYAQDFAPQVHLERLTRVYDEVSSTAREGAR